MDNFAHNRYTLGKVRLGKQTLHDFNSGNQALGNFTWVYLPTYSRCFILGYGVKINVILSMIIIFLKGGATLQLSWTSKK